MKQSIRCKFMALLGSLLLLAIPHSAVAGFNSRLEAISFTSMLEAQANAWHSLAELGYLEPGASFSWTGFYTETGWTSVAAATVNGNPFISAYSGRLSGADGAQLQVSFSGTGLVNHEDWSSSGSQTFVYDNSLGDYTTLLHTESGEINPRWGLGSTEALIGGTIGGVGGFFAGGPGVGFLGSIAGAAAGLAFSNVVFTPDPPAPVTPPPPPPPPPMPVPIPPKAGPGVDIIIINGNGTATKDSNKVSITGTFDNGVFTGTVTAVPEPSTWAMLAVGLALVCTGLRKPEDDDRLESDHPIIPAIP